MPGQQQHGSRASPHGAHRPPRRLHPRPVRIWTCQLLEPDGETLIALSDYMTLDGGPGTDPVARQAEQQLLDAKGGSLRSPPQPSPPRRACGLSGPTHRADRAT